MKNILLGALCGVLLCLIVVGIVGYPYIKKGWQDANSTKSSHEKKAPPVYKDKPKPSKSTNTDSSKDSATTSTPPSDTSTQSTQDSQTVAQPTPNPSIQQTKTFNDAALPILNQIQADENILNQEALLYNQNNQIIFNQNYRNTIQQTCADMGNKISQVRAIPVPSDPRAQTVYNTVMSAMDDLQYVASNYSQDINNMNPTDIQVCANKISEAGQYFNSASQQTGYINSGN